MKEDVTDETLITAFLQEELPKIERVVTRALRDGRKLEELAVNLERSIDGKVRGGCAPRSAVMQRWIDDPSIPVDTAGAIATSIRETPPNAVPVVLALTTPQGDLVYGVKHLEGDVLTARDLN